MHLCHTEHLGSSLIFFKSLIFLKDGTTGYHVGDAVHGKIQFRQSMEWGGWMNWPSLNPWVQLIWQRLICSFSREKPISREAKVCAIYFRKFTDSILPILFAITGNGDQGVRVAAATYLKNFIRRNMEGSMSSSQLYKEFRDQLAQTLLQAEPAILRVLIEAVSPISLESLATRCLTSKAVLLMT